MSTKALLTICPSAPRDPGSQVHARALRTTIRMWDGIDKNVDQASQQAFAIRDKGLISNPG